MDSLLATQVADRFDLGLDARVEVEAARGEQGQVRRLVTDRGSWALKESFAEIDLEEAERSARFQVRCRAGGVPCPAPVPDLDGQYVADVGGQSLRVQTWVEIDDADPLLDPALVGSAVARLHRVVLPAHQSPDEWDTEPVGVAEWQALVKAAKGAGAPFAGRLAALVPDLLRMEELLTPMTGVQWCHLDLWADNLRGTPAGGVCVIDFDNAGAGDPSRELAMVLFEFARTSRARVHALLTAYAAEGGPGRVTAAEDFGLTIAQLHHIGRHQVLGWLHARDPESRARAHAGVAEFVDDPFLPGDVDRVLGWLTG